MRQCHQLRLVRTSRIDSGLSLPRSGWLPTSSTPCPGLCSSLPSCVGRHAVYEGCSFSLKHSPFLLLWFGSWFPLFLQQQLRSHPSQRPLLVMAHSPVHLIQPTLQLSLAHRTHLHVCSLSLSDLLPVERHSESDCPLGGYGDCDCTCSSPLWPCFSVWDGAVSGNRG